ncbi:hypothetical protein BC940DRAFT_320476 [Gongronella butleri]|nr:hypothetical protein BC940DRAFT_320476 [Gongronella butleri]
MNSFPVEILQQIMLYLPPDDLLEMRLTSTLFRRLASVAYFETTAPVVMRTQSALERLLSLFEGDSAPSLPIKHLRVEVWRLSGTISADATDDELRSLLLCDDWIHIGMINVLGSLAPHLPFLRSLFIKVPKDVYLEMDSNCRAVQLFKGLPQLCEFEITFCT